MNNIILQLQKNNSSSILNNNNVLFDESIIEMGNISYDNATGIITISETGLYIIDWYAATQATSGSSGVIFKLVSDKGHEFDSNSPDKIGSMSGIAVLNADDVPVNISLVNASNADVFFTSPIISKANLRVFFLNSNAADNSRCFALNQFANVLEQLVTIYPGATVNIFSERLATITGPIYSLYKAPDSGSIPLLILGSETEQVAFNIDKITVLYFPDSAYDDSITYLEPPEPFLQNCDTDLIKNIYSYVNVGDNISVTTGPTTSASGQVYINEYGIIVVADPTSTMFLMTPHIFSLSVDAPGRSMGREKLTPVSIINE